jgi:hypothetical protein
MAGKPDYILEPRYILQLYFARTGTDVRVPAPTLITNEIVAEAWDMMNAFVMDVVDESGIEATDELFRELLIEVCYWLVFREMRALHLLPLAEQLFKHDIEHPRKPRRKKEDS